MAGWPDTLKGWAKFGNVENRARWASLSSSQRAQVTGGGSMPGGGSTGAPRTGGAGAYGGIGQTPQTPNIANQRPNVAPPTAPR